VARLGVRCAAPALLSQEAIRGRRPAGRRHPVARRASELRPLNHASSSESENAPNPPELFVTRVAVQHRDNEVCTTANLLHDSTHGGGIIVMELGILSTCGAQPLVGPPDRLVRLRALFGGAPSPFVRE
jgi:hypothetical protein